VAYTYQEADGTPAAGVAAQQALSDRTLAPGEEVRYLSTDRQTLLPRAQTTTTASGIALIGSNWSFENRIEIGGERGTDHWGSIGALLGEGWLFIESSRRRTF
ncbi:MAG TPA: hypothetical protein VK427_13865, partial [Kofleriaceae bacterium]|nr:hypothetical protein [Kofleriaceae bacterium]